MSKLQNTIPWVIQWNDETEERGINRMAKYLKMQNDRIYYYKSLEKWICNEMKKLFPINRQNSKKGNVIIVEAQGIEKPWGFWANSFKLLSCYHYYHYKYYYLLPLQSLVECQWENIFLNHLSLVEQGTYKYVGCGSFSALHVRQTFCNTTSCVIIQPPVLFNAINVVLCQ